MLLIFFQLQFLPFIHFVFSFGCYYGCYQLFYLCYSYKSSFFVMIVWLVWFGGCYKSSFLCYDRLAGLVWWLLWIFFSFLFNNCLVGLVAVLNLVFLVMIVWSVCFGCCYKSTFVCYNSLLWLYGLLVLVVVII